MTDTIPQFGRKWADEVCKERTYAFVIIQDGRNRVALKRIEGAKHLLPGCLIEDDEDKEDAIIHKIKEDTGLEIELKTVVGAANEYVELEDGSTGNDIGTFYSAVISDSGPSSKKSLKKLDWYTADTVTSAVNRRSHIWAISKMLYQ